MILDLRLDLAGRDPSVAFRLILVPARTLDTGQFCLASAARFWNVASSMPGICADVSSSIRVIANASPIFSIATVALVWIWVGAKPALEAARSAPW